MVVIFTNSVKKPDTEIEKRDLDQQCDYVIYGLIITIITIINCILPIQKKSLLISCLICVINLSFIYLVQRMLKYLTIDTQTGWFFLIYTILCNIIFITITLYYNPSFISIIVTSIIAVFYSVFYFIWIRNHKTNG